METYCVSCKKILGMKIQVLEKLNKLDSCFYQTVLSVARKNQILFEIKSSTILMINLK